MKKTPIQSKVDSELTAELYLKHKKPEIRRSKYYPVPTALASFGLIAVGLGAYFYSEGRNSIQGLKNFPNRASVVDQIHEKAMAPVRPATPAPIAQNASGLTVKPLTASQERIEAKTESLIITTNAAAVLKDLPLDAPSPLKERTAVTSNAKALELSPIFVELRGEYANLRSGPGMDYAAVGALKAGAKVKVLGWENNWFKIQARNEDGNKSQAWIRSDLVK